MMAFFSTRSSIFLFFTTLVLLSTQINARDNYFFGKFHRQSPKDQNPNNVIPLKTSKKTSVEESIPYKKEQDLDQDPTFVPQTENGYGLYGQETTYNNNNGKTFSTPSLSETEESYYNNYDDKYPKKTESYNNNMEEEFNNKYDENVKEESFSKNNEDKRSFYNSNAYGTELEREKPYKGYNHNLERQGMSDTRFMENGNYYYDLYNDRNHGRFYRKPHHKSPFGYYSFPAATENNYDHYNNNNYNNEEEKSFKDPYNSKWEQPEEFVEEQGDQFKP